MTNVPTTARTKNQSAPVAPPLSPPCTVASTVGPESGGPSSHAGGTVRTALCAGRLIMLALVPITVLGATAAAAAGTAAASPIPARSAPAPKKESLGYLNDHPCDLLTRSEVEKVVRVTMGPGQATPDSYGGSCAYNTTDPSAIINLVYGFNPGTAASVSHIKGTVHSEPSVGHGAYCVASSGALPLVELLMNVGNYQGTPYALDINIDTCAHAVALAKLASVVIF